MSTPDTDTPGGHEGGHPGGHVQGQGAGHGPGTRWEYGVDPDTGETVRTRTLEPPYTGPGQDTTGGHVQGDVRTRRVDGKPETDKDKRFFNLRESGYRGDIDQDGYPVGPDTTGTSGHDTTEGHDMKDTDGKSWGYEPGSGGGQTGGGQGGGGQTDHDHTTGIHEVQNAGGSLEERAQADERFGQETRDQTIPELEKLERAVQSMAENTNVFGDTVNSTAQELIELIRKSKQQHEEAAEGAEQGAKSIREILEKLPQLQQDLQTAKGD